jgi:hypothetical protein
MRVRIYVRGVPFLVDLQDDVAPDFFRRIDIHEPIPYELKDIYGRLLYVRPSSVDAYQSGVS